MAKLRIGDAVPDFTTVDVTGEKVSLKDFTGRYLLIAFLRYSECPWCNLALHRLVVEQPLLSDSDCNIITFIQSTPEDIQKSIIAKHNVLPNFPVIADPEMKIYNQYSVYPSVLSGLKHYVRNIPAWVQSVYKEGYTQKSINGENFLAPAAFLISPNDQRIIRADYDADLYDHESFTKIYDAMSEHAIHGLSS